jgi:hypothetical protein
VPCQQLIVARSYCLPLSSQVVSESGFSRGEVLLPFPYSQIDPFPCFPCCPLGDFALKVCQTDNRHQIIIAPNPLALYCCFCPNVSHLVAFGFCVPWNPAQCQSVALIPYHSAPPDDSLSQALSRANVVVSTPIKGCLSIRKNCEIPTCGLQLPKSLDRLQ